MVCPQDVPSIPFPRTFQTLGSKPFPWSPKLQGPFHAAYAGFMATDSGSSGPPATSSPQARAGCTPLPRGSYGKRRTHVPLSDTRFLTAEGAPTSPSSSNAKPFQSQEQGWGWGHLRALGPYCGLPQAMLPALRCSSLPP